MDIQSTLIVVSVLGPVAGFLLGTWIQARYNKELEARKHVAALSSTAFADYVKSIAQNKFAIQSEDLSAQLNALALQTDAKVRLCIYGSREVVEHLAALERTSLRLDDPTAKTAFITLCRILRGSENPKTPPAKDDDISAILFGK
jgi:hypothetical protein